MQIQIQRKTFNPKPMKLKTQKKQLKEIPSVPTITNKPNNPPNKKIR